MNIYNYYLLWEKKYRFEKMTINLANKLRSVNYDIRYATAAQLHCLSLLAVS